MKAVDQEKSSVFLAMHYPKCSVTKSPHGTVINREPWGECVCKENKKGCEYFGYQKLFSAMIMQAVRRKKKSMNSELYFDV